jgi:hypothetical protein
VDALHMTWDNRMISRYIRKGEPEKSE